MDSPLIDLIKEKILVLDGAMGTTIQKWNLSARDFGGESLEGCNEHLVLTRPDVISSIHENYLKAGADIIETNTFNANAISQADYDLRVARREKLKRIEREVRPKVT